MFFLCQTTPAPVTRTSDALFIADCICIIPACSHEIYLTSEVPGSSNADGSHRDFTARVRRDRCSKREWRNV